MEVENADKVFEEAQRNGNIIGREPCDQFWGHRNCKLIDPTGFELTFYHNISKEEELGSLISSFPIPVMSFMSGSGMRFVSATASDTAYHGGFARMATLYWQTPEGEGVILQSICPADTLDLLKDSEWHFSQIAGPTLFGIPTVRMENESMIRIHATTENGLYVFTLPASLSGSVSFLSRSLQLFTAPDRDAE